MASSLQTLIKILQLEEKKGYQNKAVIGGLGRFAYHWAREAHAQAKTDEHHALVDEIAGLLRDYEGLDESQRPGAILHITQVASGQAQPVEQHQPAVETRATEPAPPSPAAPITAGATVEAEERRPSPAIERDADEDVEGGDTFDFLFEDVGETVITAPAAPPRREEAKRGVRERRGYAFRQRFAVGEQELQGLDAPATTISGVGEKRMELLDKLGVRTIRDLLFLFPRRYDDYSRMKFIRQLEVGEEVSVIGTIERAQTIRMKNGGTRVEAYLKDDTGTLRLNWFNQPWMEKQLSEGEPVVVSGKVDQFLGRLVMNGPEVEALDRDLLHTGRVVPVYPLTAGLSGKVMRGIMKGIVDEWGPRLPDPIPLDILESADLMDYDDAVMQAHFPDSWEDKEAALLRLAFDDIFTLHLAMLQARHVWQQRHGAPLPVDDSWLAEFEATLPYGLTSAQRRAVADIRADMASDVPMNRLLQGDVGSGKTVVAAIATGVAVANEAQVAIMTPTSILAEQHHANLGGLIRAALGESVQVRLLTGNTPAAERNDIYEGSRSGAIQVVVGTHALIQEGVEFARLGLAVIDEQHRFGVLQRGALREKGAGGSNPHLLVMTATPIPRTLALTIHADLDLTIIDEMPPGREPIETRVLQPKERERAYSFIRGQVEQGHQAYIVYPLVEESEKLDAKAATAEYERLQQTIFPNLRMGLLHGRMSGDEKDAVMAALYHAQIDILVSTSVIEVGIDVPNATVMLIENANRFGLAQLHQLRGRVGRGGHKGYCLLVSDKAFLDGDERLSAIERTTDGFKLAQIDWEMRGAGDLLGTRQSGFSGLDLSYLMDAWLVETVQREAWKLFERDPLLEQSDHRLLAERVHQAVRLAPEQPAHGRIWGLLGTAHALPVRGPGGRARGVARRSAHRRGRLG